MAKAKKLTMPDKMAPMLATLAREPFTHKDWVYEIKWDGYRILAYVQKGKVTLYSRGGQDYTSRYPAVVEELSGLKDCVIDGEIVVLDEDGKPDFSALQNYQGVGDIAYYIFDLIYFDGESFLTKPLLQRKEMLLHVITKENILTYSDHFDDGIRLLESMQKLGLEGIVAKHKESLYQPGQRSKDWLKIKINQRREYVIGGWSESENTTSFRSILFGEFVDGQLKYVHHSGGGYTSKEKSHLFKSFRELEMKKCPFVNPKDIIIDTRCHWVKPELIAEFELSTSTTKTGIIRHPAIFKGLREDKKANEVVEELPIKAPEPVEQPQEVSGSWESIKSRKITSEEAFAVDGKTINLVNIERHVWKDVTKAELIQYYISISEYLLPYLKDRPLGINISQYDPKESFFLRGMEGNQPKWAKTFKTDRKHQKAGKSDKIEWLVCNDLATLVWIINQDCIDIHPWASRITSPNEPDYIGIDLDPSDDDFNKVIETALATKQLLDNYKLQGFVKTSGKSGMHIYVPCSGIEYGQSRTIAENMCQAIHELVPAITTVNTSVNSRGNKLYVDPSQNDYADRLAAAYCVRANGIPTVSTPLEWKEVIKGLDPGAFTIHTIGKRLKRKGDLFTDLLLSRIATLNYRNLSKRFG